MIVSARFQGGLKVRPGAEEGLERATAVSDGNQGLMVHMYACRTLTVHQLELPSSACPSTQLPARPATVRVRSNPSDPARAQHEVMTQRATTSLQTPPNSPRFLSRERPPPSQAPPLLRLTRFMCPATPVYAPGGRDHKHDEKLPPEPFPLSPNSLPRTPTFPIPLAARPERRARSLGSACRTDGRLLGRPQSTTASQRLVYTSCQSPPVIPHSQNFSLARLATKAVVSLALRQARASPPLRLSYRPSTGPAGRETSTHKVVID